MQALAQSTSDNEVVQFMMFGWPLNHDDSPVTLSCFNHASALRYPETMERYI